VVEQRDGISELIHSRLTSGRLPIAGGHRLFGGSGDGSICACCDRFVTRGQIQFEVECPARDGSPIALLMHVECFDVWCKESRALRARNRSTSEWNETETF
jgi:hypothetical protein